MKNYLFYIIKSNYNLEMSAPIKKRALQIEGSANEERSSSDDVSEEEEAQEYTGQEVSKLR